MVEGLTEFILVHPLQSSALPLFPDLLNTGPNCETRSLRDASLKFKVAKTLGRRRMSEKTR